MNRVIKKLLNYLAIGAGAMLTIAVVVGIGAYVWYYKEAFAAMFAFAGLLMMLGFYI